jgi:hypothetical protein
MRADPAGWPYQDPGGDDPDWTGGGGHRDWTSGDDSWPAGGATSGWPYGEDHPSWPAGEGSWRGGDGSWPSGGASAGWPYGEDHPSWPAGSGHPDWPGGGDSALPGREPPTMHYDGRRPSEPAAWVPAGDGPEEASQWSGQQVAAAVEAAYYDVAAGDGRARVLPPCANQDWPQITANEPAELLDPVRRDTGGLRGEDSVRLTERILSDADTQAAAVTQEALDYANAIRQAAEREAEEIKRQAAYEAGAAREAGRQAGELKRQAAEQAEAMREAAEREADELRAGAIRLSAELGEVAAYVTRTLTIPAMPVPEPQALPRRHVGEDFALPATRAAEPEARAAARPRSQARSGRYYTEDLDRHGRPGGGPVTWEPEEAWEQETWGPEGWEPESPPAAQPRPQRRTHARPQGRGAAQPRRDGRTPTRPRPATWPATTGPEAWPPPAEPDDGWPPLSPEEIWPTRPADQTTTRPATRPGRRPVIPATRPAKRRTEKPARSRQYRSMRAFAGTITALVVLALGTGAYQLATRGFTFFVFRSAGTGATDNNAIFPGIIPTPKPSPAHHHPTTGPSQHGARRTRHHAKGTAGRSSHG